MKNTPDKLISVVLWLGVVFFISIEGVPAQPTLKEQNRTKDFGKSLRKSEKKEKADSKDTQNNNSEDEETIRVKTDLVVSDVLVLNQKGSVILGLDQNDFVVTEDGIPQKISVFSFGENANIPRSIVLLIDYSGSLYEYIKQSIEGAKLLVDKLGSQDRMAIVTDDVKLLVDFTNDKALLKKKLDSLEKKSLGNNFGDSKQYSALVATLNEMFDKEDIRPIIIFQTDGDELPFLKPPKNIEKLSQWYKSGVSVDQQANFSLDDIHELVGKSRATIYSIIPGLRLIGLSQKEQIAKIESVWGAGMKRSEDISSNLYWRLMHHYALFDIAELSGGYTDYIEQSEDAKNVYSNIFAVINNRYLIGYYPANEERNGKWRNVKIEVRNHPEFIVTGRKAYLTPAEEK
jgi:VWFA-related protein